MSTRLEVLQGLLQQNPNDTFARYGLAMEYARLDELDKAVACHRELLNANADYVAAYYHAGQALEKLGRIDEARSMYEDGIDAAARTGDAHARSELQAALDILG